MKTKVFYGHCSNRLVQRINTCFDFNTHTHKKRKNMTRPHEDKSQAKGMVTKNIIILL